MTDDVYLVFTKKGVRRVLQATGAYGRERQRPPLAAGEYAVRLKITVPDGVFSPPPMAKATIVIPDSLVFQPEVQVEAKEPGPVAIGDANYDG